MSGLIRDTSAPSSWPEHSGAATSPVPAETTIAPSAADQHIPDELLISLSSTVCSSSSSTGPGSHHQHCKGCGVRRPDAVWHRPFGRNKYRYFLEQPTSVTGAGRDISFLCDATITQRRAATLPPLTDRSHPGDNQLLTVSENLIPEDYRIVTNKGLRSLEFYEDAFTVQLHDDEHNLRPFPSLRPSGRLEAVQLMRTMDSMLQEAGVDQQCEELTELSQMEGLLELVQVEQKIYNIVFHELIRQVSVGCAERGQLLAKLRHRYQSLLERIPCRLRGLHTEVVAQRALDRQLTEEIHRVKTSIQQLSIEMSKITEHDAFVFHQAEHAHQQLAEALDQTFTSLDVVRGYHDLYELQRGRLEAQLLQATEERDCWSQVTLRLALKVISAKKLKLVSRLHICEQSWFRTAEHCVLYLTKKDTHDLNVIMKLTHNWTNQLTAFLSQLKKSEQTQCEQISAVKQSIIKWLVFCTAENKCADAKYEKTILETMHEDFKQWLHILAIQCERYEGDNVLSCQQTLGELTNFQERWFNMSDQLLKRHLSPDGQLPGGYQVLSELERMLLELFRELGAQVSGENGIHKQIMSLYSLIESWVPKLDAVISQHETVSVPDWLKLEKALNTCQSLAEEVFNISSLQTDKDTVKMFDKVQEFRTNLSNFTNGENQRLSEEVDFIHMAQTHWMLDLLLLMVPDHGEDQNQNQQDSCTKSVSLATLDENSKMLVEKLNYCSKYISSSYQLILDEQISQNLHQDENDNEKNECTKLQMESMEWVETCMILLSDLKAGPDELPIRRPVTVSRSNIPVDPATKLETQEKVEPLVCEKAVVKLIGYDGNITERILGESNVHLCGTHELVVTPVTDEAQKAFGELTTVGQLQEELYDSELRVQTAEQRALKSEEALQAAFQKIQDLERQLQGHPSLEPQNVGKTTETPAPLPPPVTLSGPQPAPPKTAPMTTSLTTGTRKFKKH